MKHVHDLASCPCRDSVNLLIDPVIQIMGHKFKLPIGTFTADQIAEALELESGPIGIHCSVVGEANDPRVSIDVSEFMKRAEVSEIFHTTIRREPI